MKSDKLQYPGHQKLLKITGIAFMLLGLILFLIGYFEITNLDFFAYLVGGFGFFIYGYIYKVEIDPSRGVIKVTKGFLLPLSVKEYHKSHFQKIIVRKEVSHNNTQNSSPGTSSFKIRYAIILKATSVEVRVEAFNKIDEAISCKKMLETQLDIPSSANEVLEEKRKAVPAKLGAVIIILILGAIGWVIYLAMTV